MIIVKLGGSVITNKQRPQSYRGAAVRRLASELSNIKEPMILVHGGGSYGHYWSVKYDMHTKPRRYNAEGVSVVKNSMVELHHRVLRSAGDAGIIPYSVAPDAFAIGANVKRMRWMADLSRHMAPVTYGDAIWEDGKSYILSGDVIMGMLARVLRPRLAVFALAEDGVYRDMASKKVIERLDGADVKTSEVGMDVTGGMSRKITEAKKISKYGTDVFFVNGNRPGRITSAVKNNAYEGTILGGRKGSRRR